MSKRKFRKKTHAAVLSEAGFATNAMSSLGLIKQFLKDVHWGDELDYLIIDCPPGTSMVACCMLHVACCMTIGRTFMTIARGALPLRGGRMRLRLRASVLKLHSCGVFA